MSTAGHYSSIVKIICTIAIAAMVLVSISVYHASITGILEFMLFILLYVQLPGMLIVRLARLDLKHISEELLLSFFIGWFLIVVEYFITDLINTNAVLYVLGPVCSALLIFRIIKSRDNVFVSSKLNIRAISVSLCITVVILMAYVFLNTQFLYMAPEYSSNTYIDIDKAYQGGLIGSLSKGYPIQSPWVAGVIEYYHIFSQLLLSVPVRLFGLAPIFVVMSCAPFLTVCLISLSFYSLFRHFCKRKNYAGLYTLSVVLSHMFIARAANSSYLFRILFVNDNYAGFSVACVIACVILLDSVSKSSREHSNVQVREMLVVMGLFMLLTGIKAPVALVLIGAMFGTYILGLILKAMDLKSATSLLLFSFIGFISAFMFLLGPDDTSGVGTVSNFRFGKMTGVCFWKSSLIEHMTNAGIPPFIRLLIIIITFTLFFFTIYSIPLAVGYLRELVLVISKKKDFDFTRVTVYAAVLVGFVLMMFLSYSGHSQVYFGTVSAVFAPLISFWFFEDRDIMTPSMSKLLAVSKLWFFATIVVTGITLASGMYSMLPGAIKHADPKSSYNPYISLSSGEYEATQWLKNNVPEDSLIATQMYSSVSESVYDDSIRWNNCHFLYATYSERFYYLEGSGFTLEDFELPLRREMIRNNKQLFDPANASRGQFARKLGVDYVMVTKKIHPTEDLSSDEYNMVFSNSDVDIYQITSSD